MGLGQHGHHGHGGNRHGRGADADLGRHRGHGHGAFGTNALVDGDVVDDGEHGVGHVPGAAHDGERPGGDGSQQGDVLGMLAQNPLGHPHEDVEAAGSLQGGGAADDGQDGEHDVDGRLAGLHAKNKAQHKQADAADKTQAHTAKAGAQQQASQDDTQLQGEHDALSFCSVPISRARPVAVASPLPKPGPARPGAPPKGGNGFLPAAAALGRTATASEPAVGTGTTA